MHPTPTKTVTLYIGRYKTGSSSIKATLAAHHDLLRSRGVLYPASLQQNHSRIFKDAFFPRPELHPYNRKGLTRAALRKRAKNDFAAIEKEVATTDSGKSFFQEKTPAFCRLTVSAPSRNSSTI